MQTVDWSRPQRQPAAGLLIALLHTLGQLLKKLWPLLVLLLVKGKAAKTHWYEIAGGLLFLFSIAGSLWRFFYFRFYIEGDNLIVKSGWLQKKTTIIPLANIQSVDVSQGPVHQVLGLVRLSIDTAGSQKAEAIIEALRKPMAVALREQLLEKRSGVASTAEQRSEEKPLIHLTDKDLFKLSVSANHLRALFLFFVFISSLFDAFNEGDETILPRWLTFLPGSNADAYLFLGMAVLLITTIVSSGDIFLRYHEFSVFKKPNGFHITTGLFQVKEKVIAMKKVQLISWQASWIRKRLRLWMLEYHIAGSDEANQKSKMRIPVTEAWHLPLLVHDYHPVPVNNNGRSIRMHPSYVFRKFLVAGLFPTLLFIALLWKADYYYTLWILLYPLLVALTLRLRQKKFRLWAMNDVLYLEQGAWGEEKILLQWQKLQTIELRQGIYQRRKGLATVMIHTAGGQIRLPFIPLQAAQQLVNFSLYKTESSQESWQ